MISIDKIINNVAPEIIETINLLAKENNLEQLKKWLKECREEIKFRGPHNCYKLQLEKAYLEAILNVEKPQAATQG